MERISADAARWLRRRMGIGHLPAGAAPTPFDIGFELGQEDRQAGRPDLALLDEFGFTPAERELALAGWRRGFSRGD